MSGAATSGAIAATPLRAASVPATASAAVSPRAIAVLAALLEARTGQGIASHRNWRLDTELRPLLRERGLDTLDQLVLRLLGGGDPGLGDRIVEALVNGETSFFRDAPAFDLLADALAADATPDRRSRIWSAGCAGGQEPFSLAMLLAERAGAEGGGAAALPEIVATDVSEAALIRARAGRFTHFEIQRGLPVRRMMRWFEGEGDCWTVRAELLRLVRFRRLNLVDDRPPPGAPYDAVLCRNVMLYFSAGMRTQVFATLAAALRPGGLLVLGAGETVIGQTDLFQPSLRFRGLYERTDAAPPRATLRAS